MSTISDFTWGPDIAARARAALASDDLPERPWIVLSVRDHLTLYGDGVVAKVARPGMHGSTRLTRGLRTALELADAGHPVQRPLFDLVRTSDIGPVSLWPYVRNAPLDASTLTPDLAERLGATLARLAQHKTGAVEWYPFDRLDERMDAGTGHVPNTQLLALTDLARKAYDWAVESGAWENGHTAHGDFSLDNVLLTGDTFSLIELDALGLCPAGWDLACLLLRVNLQTYNPAAAAAAAAGWAQHAPVPEPDQLAAMMAVKLVKSTSYALLSAAVDPVSRAMFADRLAVLQGPLERRELPPFIPTRSQYTTP